MTKSDLPPAANAGTVLGGKYRVERVLGRGGMGVVLLATHLELQKRVAVKLLLAKASATVSTRFRREAQVAAQLVSPHIAQVLDFGVSEELPFLVMEYLEGHDLETELEQRRAIPASEAIDLVLEGSLGVAQAHAAGLVHRDLKPANLFLSVSRSGKRTVKVLDFGLIKDSTESQSLTASAEVFGTPQYMAPEQIQSSKNVDARCDQHALALVLFELIAGTPAYRAESLPHLIVVIATHPPPWLGDFLPGCPQGLAQVLVTALAKQPAGRFPHLGAFARALAPFGGPRSLGFAEEIEALLANVPAPANVASRASTSGTEMMGAPHPEALATHLPPTAASPTLQGVAPQGVYSATLGNEPSFGAQPALGPRPAHWAVGTEPSFNGSVPALSHPVLGGAATVGKPRSNLALLLAAAASVCGLALIGGLVFALRGSPTSPPAASAAEASSSSPGSTPPPSAAPSPAITPEGPPPSPPSPPEPPASPDAPSAKPATSAPRPPSAGSAKKPPKPPKPPGTKCTGLACY